MKYYNRLTKAWAVVRSEKAKQISHRKDKGFLIIASLLLLIGIYALLKIYS
ncbi:MAG: hypothetical protein AB8G86_20970 [Saprospiraceae bacterium]